MSKLEVKGSTLLAPLPAVMVSVGDMDNANVITIAWTGIICSQPPRLYISVRHDRYSYDLLKKHMEFVVNTTSLDLLAACDYCGIRSGREVDKFAEMGFTKIKATHISTPMIAESPICLECKVFDIIPLGSHDMFLADIVAVHADESIVTEGKIDYTKAHLVSYQHGHYYASGKQLGRFGFAAQKEFIKRHGKGVSVNMATATLTQRKDVKTRSKRTKK